MHAILIFAIGSPLVVDIEESAARAGINIFAAVRNAAGPSYCTDPRLIVDLGALGAALKSLPFVVPLFNPENRKTATEQAEQLGLKLHDRLIDPSSIVPRRLDSGAGLYINAGSTLGAAGVLGKSVLINRGVTLGHHANIGDYVSIGPGAVIAGNVSIGTGSMIGAGAVILPKRTIGINATVGAGAVVTKDVPDNYVAIGNPARLTNSRRASE